MDDLYTRNTCPNRAQEGFTGRATPRIKLDCNLLGHLIYMKPIKGFPNYLISEDGAIFNIKTKKWLKRDNKNDRGYQQATLTDSNGVRKTTSIHKCVYSNYVGDIEQGLQINHIDGNKENNHFLNLEMVTQSENIRHAFSIGLMKSGWKSKFSKPINKICIETGSIIETYESLTEVWRQTKFNRNNIRRCINGKKHSVCGFKWQYASK